MVSSNEVLKINDESFEKVISEGVVLVDFWAEWCGPCRMQGPILDEVVKEVGEQAVIAKLNVDDSPVTAQKYKVMSIPTLLLFKDGEVAETFVGVQQQVTLTETIKGLL